MGVVFKGIFNSGCGFLFCFEGFLLYEFGVKRGWKWVEFEDKVGAKICLFVFYGLFYKFFKSF